MKNKTMHIAAMLFAGWLAGPVQAYEEIAVSDGGTLSGSVTLVGEIPKPKSYNFV